ncbi:MAG: sigma-70 family RNA polymerase sigma factor [Verrucomicrobiota bacterium]
MTSPHESAAFAPTRWTLIQRARGSTPEARQALSDLCEAYWNPVFHFLRKAGRSEEEARELTQEFFARLLARGGLATAEQGKGKFRSFLLGAVKHFLSDVRDHARRLKRGGGHVPNSIEAAEEAETGGQVADPNAAPIDALFDRQWAITVMERALGTVAREFCESGKSEQFETLKAWLVGEAPALSQAAAADQLSMTEGALKVAIHRLRKRFREVIRAEIGQTLGEGDNPEEELRYLVQVLSCAARDQD